MKIARFTLLVLSLFIVLSGAFSQSGGYNQWLDHLPYSNCKAVAEAPGLIFAATPYSVMYYDRTDNSMNRLNKVVGGLSDIGISSIAYSSKVNALVIAYQNTNIDIVKGSTVINIPDIKRKQILGNKTINSITIIDNLAYLSCGFGIVVLDLAKEEIKDTYYIGASGSQLDVKTLTFNATDNKFYAATEKGIYSALASSNLAFYVNWVQNTSITGPNDNFNLIVAFGGKVYANKTKYTWDSDTMFVKNGEKWNYFVPNDHWPRTSMRVCGDRMVISSYVFVTTYRPDGSEQTRYETYTPGAMRPVDALLDSEGLVWVADNDKALWSIGTNLVGTNYIFNGPASSVTTAMDISGRHLWAVPGGRSATFDPLYKNPEFYTLNENSWSSYDKVSLPEMINFRDILCVAADPGNGNHVFMGSWGMGLIEFENNALKKIYNVSNSSLQYYTGFGEGYLRIGGMAFDNKNNLWVTNSSAPNILSVRKATGEWKSFNLGNKGTGIDVGGIVIDDYNQKWLQLRDFALFVFNDNNTPDITSDDQSKKLTSSDGLAKLDGSSIASMAVDREGQLWLGTDQGVARIYSPGNVFNGGNYDADQVMVEEEGYLHPLLGTEAITAIAINGNNEKWLGTDKSGVFLMSADGTKELLHFTSANSPLLSNTIQSIKIADNGEVYFATSLGIVSYMDYKVAASPSLDSLIVYPNPVRPEYQGPVFISNLVTESNVKITDIAGALVFETQAYGGRVIWDGHDLEGKKVNTGVYLIFVTNPDGTQKKAQKILFVR